VLSAFATSIESRQRAETAIELPLPFRKSQASLLKQKVMTYFHQ
jgi:hypothetical protein